jgi:PPOX class probable F420-dependent enzyme
MKPPDSHTDLLERPVFAHLATVRPDGAPQATPMWFLWDPQEGVIKLTHTKERYNFRNIQHEPRVSLSITDPDNAYRYLSMRGVVEKIEDDPTGDFYNVLSRRYRGHPIEVKDKDVRVILHVRPTVFRSRDQ